TIIVCETLIRARERATRAELELRESEERFRFIANSAPVLIWMSGPDKLRHWFNEPWLQFTGRTMEQEIGHGWKESVHPEDLHGCLETYTLSFEARKTFAMEYRLRNREGVFRWILDHGIPRFGHQHEFLGYIGSCVDIEDQKRVE